jgi:hypoxanthine phosphoribosyltransferase
MGNTLCGNVEKSSAIYVTANPSSAPLKIRIHDVRNPNSKASSIAKNAIIPSIYENHLSTLLIDRYSIQSRTKEIAKTIHSAYPHDEPLVIICILKGSSPFFHGLCQELSALGHPYMIEFYRMKSYEGTESTGKVRVTQELPESIVGRHVIVVEDIVDTGNTLKALLPTILVKNPKSCKICSMLVKRLASDGDDDGDDDVPVGEMKDFELDDTFVGFSIPDAFIVGCGLDFNEMYRDLSDIWVLSEVGIKAGGYGL